MPPVPAPTAEPQRDEAVALRDGRTLAFAEWGPHDGHPVVLLHGMPGSRKMCPDVDVTIDAGVRLLAPDRPGYGLSTPNPGRTLLSWVDDFIEFLDQARVDRCHVLGWSSGGPYALACAYRLPERVIRVGLLASVAPLDEVPGEWSRLEPEVRALTEQVRADAEAARAGVADRVSWFADGWGDLAEPDGDDADDVLLTQPAAASAIFGWMGEARRQATAGYIEDWIAESRPWQFALGDVAVPTDVWWGDDDQLVARAHTDTLAAHIPGAVLHVVPDAGHLFPIPCWREVLAATLAGA